MSSHPQLADGPPVPHHRSPALHDGQPAPGGRAPAPDGAPSVPELGLVAPTDGPDAVCITCADQADVAEIVEVVDAHTVRARTANGLRTVDTTLLADACIGDRVLVHAGTVISDLPVSHDPEGTP